MGATSKSRFIAVVFGCALLLALAGCGGGSSDDIPNRQASELLGLVDSIRQSVDAGNCTEAGADASTLSVKILELDPAEVPDDVITALNGAGQRLKSLVDTECGVDEESETTTTTTTTTTPEEPTTTEPETTTQPETTTTGSDTTTTTPEETTTTGTSGDGGGGTGGTGAGGTEAPGGGSKG